MKGPRRASGNDRGIAPRGPAPRARAVPNANPTQSPGWNDGGRSSGPRISAGHALAVGLLCFAIWIFFDARQLFQGADASPLGTRRTVAMTILRPVARVEAALSLDRVVNVVDRLIGKSGSPGGSASSPTTTFPVTSTTIPRGESSTTMPRGKSTTTTSPPVQGPTPIRQPTPTRPLTILTVGDSIGEDLGIGLANELGNSPSVHVIQQAVGDTGLANLGYFNWIAQLPVEIKKYHPQVVVMMLGGNDAQPFQSGNTIVQPGTALWRQIYSSRVADLISEATSSNVHIVWVGLPIMGPTSGLPNSDMQAENAEFSAGAAAHPGATYISTWKLFENAAGQYSTYLNVGGSGLVQVRDSDEVHIDPPGGTNLLGSYVISRLEALWHVRL